MEDVSFTVGIWDSSIPFNLDDYVSGCGNPPIYTIISPGSTGSNLINIAADIFEMDDSAGALSNTGFLTNEGTLESCSPQASKIERYFYYPSTAQLGQSSTNQSCNIGNTESYTGPCSVTFSVGLTSTLVTKLKSSRGTTTLQIFLDEGSIIGAIFFFTWFFSIFVI